MLPIQEYVLTTPFAPAPRYGPRYRRSQGPIKDDMSLLVAPNNIVEAGSLYTMMKQQLKGRLSGHQTHESLMGRHKQPKVREHGPKTSIEWDRKTTNRIYASQDLLSILSSPKHHIQLNIDVSLGIVGRWTPFMHQQNNRSILKRLRTCLDELS